MHLLISTNTTELHFHTIPPTPELRSGTQPRASHAHSPTWCCRHTAGLSAGESTYHVTCGLLTTCLLPLSPMSPCLLQPTQPPGQGTRCPRRPLSRQLRSGAPSSVTPGLLTASQMSLSHSPGTVHGWLLTAPSSHDMLDSVTLLMPHHHSPRLEWVTD